MNPNALSPYIRAALRSELSAPFQIRDRIIFDFEIIYLESGSWRLTYEGKEYLCMEGDILFLCPGRPHKIDSLPGVSVSQPHIHFDLFYDEISEKIPVCFKRRADLTKEEEGWIRTDFWGETLSSPVLRLKNAEEVKATILESIDLFCEKPPLFALLCKASLIRLIYLLWPTLSQGAPLPEAPPENRLAMVRAYIDQNFAGELSLSLLARQFHMDKFTLSKRFAAAYGISVIAYRNNVRLEKARAMLAKEAGVSETAAALGFSSVYAFSRFFKQKTGEAPSLYARNAQIKKPGRTSGPVSA